MSDERNTNTESPEQTFVPPGEPITDPEVDIKPPTRGWMPYGIIGGALLAIVALVAVLVGSDLTGLADDGDVDVAIEKLVEETTSAPTMVDDTNDEVMSVRLAGIDASECELSKIEMKDGALVIERDCLKLVFEDMLILSSP